MAESPYSSDTASGSLLVAWYSNCFSAAGSTSGFRNWQLFSSIDLCAVVSNYSYSLSNCCCNGVTFVVTVYGDFFGEPNSSPHEVSRGFISPKPPQIKKCDVWIYNFTWKFEFMRILSFMWTKKLTMHLPLGLPSHLSSLLLFLNDIAKKEKKQHKKSRKVHVGMEPQKPTKLDGNDTTTPSHHPYILCHLPPLTQVRFVFVCREGLWKAVGWVVVESIYV